MLDKKQIQSVFLFEFKMSHKAVEKTHNINSTFGPGTANECTVQWWFKKSCKGDENFEETDSIIFHHDTTPRKWTALLISRLLAHYLRQM